MGVSLEPLAAGRDNNLNLIRLIAALCVLVSHAWPIALGPGTTEPLERATGYSLGTFAVLVFFAISGFLISASYERSAGVWPYLRARVARIYPALIVSIALVTLGLGPVFTELSIQDYLQDARTWDALLGNASLLHLEYTLPAVFTQNPYPTVQGSIWSLPIEMALYLATAAVGFAGLLRGRLVLSLLGAGLLVALFAGSDLGGMVQADFWMPALAFGTGMLLYLWRSVIPASPWIALALIGAAALSGQGGLHGPLICLATGYGAIWLALLPSGVARRWNALGDYSYGVYIYAFPVQGAMMAWLGPMAPMSNVALSLPVTLALAILSWHWIERPALRTLRRPRVAAQVSGPECDQSTQSTGPRRPTRYNRQDRSRRVSHEFPASDSDLVERPNARHTAFYGPQRHESGRG
ncbi:acyltransferase [Thioclava sp. BHET1]|nr:acyltransferase [Thioclava sp. BHET1]